MYVLLLNWFVMILNGWVQNQISSGTKLTMQRVMRRLHLCLGEGSEDIWSLTLGKIFNSLLISIVWFTFRKDYHYHWLIVINFAVMYNLFFVIGRSVFWELDSLFPRVRIRGVFFPENQGCIFSQGWTPGVYININPSHQNDQLANLRVGFWLTTSVTQSTYWTCWSGCTRATLTRASWWRTRPCWGRTTGRAEGWSWT